jgi:hypothetical protein
MSNDHERIWLQNAKDALNQDTGRMWCEDKVWPDDAEDGEPTEYVRADLYEAVLSEKDSWNEMSAVIEFKFEDDATYRRTLKEVRDNGFPTRYAKYPTAWRKV